MRHAGVPRPGNVEQQRVHGFLRRHMVARHTPVRDAARYRALQGVHDGGAVQVPDENERRVPRGHLQRGEGLDQENARDQADR